MEKNSFMFFRSKTLILLGLVLILETSCINFKVYVPGEFPIPENALAQGKTLQIVGSEDYAFIAHIEPFFLTSFFYKKKYRNYFGTLEEILQEEFIRNQKIYFHKYSNLKVTVKDYDLRSQDGCFRNKASIRFHAIVEEQNSNSVILEFNQEKEMLSYSSDCNGFLTGVTIVGLLWFVPYIGFRGTKQEQMEYLGKGMLRDFFEELQIKVKSSDYEIEIGEKKSTGAPKNEKKK
ncbi:MAG: hypothetical protein SFU98_05270 [Leptospiraceae bacterium]|nr:hypothetical protein [Leptospiraceae bacterium]